MKISLFPPQAIYESGQRDNNEDAIYPTANDIKLAKTTRLFLVCDGVGGLEKGEVASQIACEVIADYLKDRSTIKENVINQAVDLTRYKFNQYIQNNPDANGMATTLSLLAFHEEGVTLAHMGDTRIYQIRNGKVIFKTIDHSFVSGLVKKKIISPEEANQHPKRNVITNAIMATQYNKAEINYLSNIQEDDYFFMCTDGILESISENDLLQILGDDNLTNLQKRDQIKVRCEKNSRDNFSAYIVQIQTVNDVYGKFLFSVWSNQRTLFLGALGIIAFNLIVFLFFFNRKQPNSSVEEALDMLNTININEIDVPHLDNSNLNHSDTLSVEYTTDSTSIDSSNVDSLSQ